ncbi:serine/threonine-protein kinase [Streptomyces sp. NBC_00838]|uniref:protein kinase domain-containing protein n=1 Tax=Streptomyces sp. NBC_00838 TaxID=2903680 RepID=UPI0038632C5A|nr:serine/threonine-protein kinase [Streptomyces sp. NBC_00838]
MVEQLGGYRLVALLGEGGMGRVHLGRAASGRLVAVKTVHEHLAADPRFRERFRREAAAARSVAGPFTAAVLDADPAAVRPWLATEFCTGPTLTGAVSALGPLASGELAALGAALAEAIAAVHAAGLVHRDLKPSNIVVTRDGPMVIDFGIARTSAEESLTDSGEIVGSPGFIAPELLTGAGEPGPAVDVFALGALLAYAATGRPPFGTGAVHQVLYRTMHGRADLDGLEEIPGGREGATGWRELLGSCLSREPADRPAVAGVLAACAAWTEGDPWWEREAVAGLIRRREDEVAALVANAPETTAGPADPGLPADPADVPADAPDGERADEPGGEPGGNPRAPATTVVSRSPGTTVAPDTGSGTVASRGASRRTLLRWGGAALAGGSAIGAVAWLASLTGRAGDDDEPDPPPSYTLGRALWTRGIGKASAFRHDDALYLTGADGLIRLDARTGTVGWIYPADDIADVVPGRELIHVLRVTGLLWAEVVVLDAETGVEKWSTGDVRRHPRRPLELRRPDALPDGDQAAFSVSAELLCLVTHTRYATLWDRRTGEDIPWRAYGYDPRTGDPLWFHQGGEAEVMGLHQAGGRIAVASARSSLSDEGEEGEPLAVLRAADGTLEREIPGGSRYVEAHPGSRGARCYRTGGRLRSVDLATRRTRWSRALSEEQTDATITPTATAGLVHTATYDTLKALDAETGRTRWSLEDIGWPVDRGSPTVSGGLVYGLGRTPEGEKTPNGRPTWGVHARNAATGALVWAAETGDARSVLVGDGGEGEDATGSGLVHVSADGTLSTYAAPEPI